MIWLLFSLACSGPDKDRDLPVVLPVVAGWIVDQETVLPGDEVVFRMEIDWLGQAHDHMQMQTLYDLRGVREITWTDTSFEVRLPAIEPGIMESIGGLRVCNGDPATERCEEIALRPGRARVAGGDAVDLVSPALELSLVVGERRALHATPLTRRGTPTVAMSHEPVTYRSTDPDVLTVDSFGFVEAIAPGTATLWWEAADAEPHSLFLTVVDGEMGPPEQGRHPVFEEGLTWHTTNILNSSLRDRVRDSFSVDPQGYPAFVASPWLVDVVPLNEIPTQPLYLVRWTGSGFGYEQVSGWEESALFGFLGFAPDGHEFVGWRSDWEQGLVVLDRAPGTGAWQRRLLPIHPLLEAPPGWTLRAPTHHVDPVIATMPADDGLWVAYGVSYDPGAFGYDPGDCLRILRLAHVTSTSIEVEDIEVAPLAEGGNNSLCSGSDIEYLEHWSSLDLAPGRNTAGTPKVLAVLGRYQQQGTYSSHTFELSLTGWEETASEGTLYSWSPWIDAPAFETLVVPEVGWAYPGPDGAHVVMLEDDLSARRHSPYGGDFRSDSLLGPHYPGAYEVVFGSDLPLHGLTADDQRVYTLTDRTTGGGLTGAIALVATDQVRAPLHDDPETSGTRLFDEAFPDHFDEAVVLSDGTRLLAGDPYPVSATRFARSDGPGQPWIDLGNSPSTTLVGFTAGGRDSEIWAVGDTVYAAFIQQQGLELWRSDDVATSWTQVGRLEGPEGLAEAVTVTTDRHAFLVREGTDWSLVQADETAEGWTTETQPALPAGTLVTDADREHLALYVIDGELWSITRQYAQADSTLTVTSRRFDASGAIASEQTVPLPAELLPGLGAVTAAGALVIPIESASTSGVDDVRVSSDGGATWQAAGLDLQLFKSDLAHGLTSLADGRLAIVAADQTDPSRWHVRLRTSSDGLVWSDPVALRPQGGGVQRVWDAVGEPDGGLLVHLADSGTHAAWFASLSNSPDPDPGNPAVLRVAAP